MQFQVLESDDSCQPGPQYTNPPVVVEEHHGAPLLNCSGLVVARCARPLHPRRRAPASGSAPFCPHTQPTRAPRSVTGRYREPAHRSRRRDAAPLRRHRS